LLVAQPTIGLSMDGLLAMSGTSAPAAPTGLPSALSAALPPSVAAVLSQQSQATTTALTSTVLACINMMKPEELVDTEEREGLKEDVGDECKKYGVVEEIKIPITGNDKCGIFVKFATIEAAEKAVKALSGRKFDGNVVEVSGIPESTFLELMDGK